MGILLVRHAEAVQERSGLDDTARWLTKAGRAQAREVAELVHDRGVLPTRIVASPRVRAVQTAELFAQVLQLRGVIECLPSLSYTQPAELAARELSAFDESEHLAAFGHMPTIAEICARLTGGKHDESFATSQAVWIEDGRVQWSVKPR
jgi:phosphohistidine phosphatase